MKTDKLQEVISWLKTTDVVELSYKDGAEGFSLSTPESQAQPHYPAPQGRYQPVTAPAVGLFQFGAPGKPRKLNEGAELSEGEEIGRVETAPGKSEAVKSPCAGRVARLFVDAGAAVEYGQPLLFLEPR